MSIEKYNLTKNEHKCDKWFDVDKIKGDLNVRSRRPGDKINISVGNKKLKNLFIDIGNGNGIHSIAVNVIQ